MGCMETYSEQFDVCPYCGYIHGTPAKEAYHITPGSLLKKRYQVGRVLGFGGFGITYIGYDLVLEQKVAIKEYLPSEFSTRMPEQQMVTIYSGDSEEQFKAGLKKTVDEARRLAQFQNVPEIVHIYDCFEANNTAYIVMEYLDGESLKEKLDREGKMSVEEALPIIETVIRGLKVVHKEGIIHRDIAPDNIYIQKDGSVKLLDFGAARYATTQHSKSLSVIIKPGYAPEEQYRSRGDQGPWTDVYALAATFYKMITGITPEDAMERSVKDEVKEPSRLGVHINKNTETALMNAMNVKIQCRTQSAEDFEAELKAAEVKRVEPILTKEDLGSLPTWVKILVPSVAAVFLVVMALLVSGVIPLGDKVAEFKLGKGRAFVPDVINQQKETAEQTILSANLQPEFVDAAFNDEIIAGRILEQDPGTGQETSVQSVVHLTVSRGQERVQIPELIGKLQADAEKALQELGLSYEIEEVESPAQAGTIASIVGKSGNAAAEGELSELRSGESVEKNTTVVVLQVSTGLKEVDEDRDVIVPELTGMQIADAQEMLSDTEEYGVELKITEQVYDEEVPNGAIMIQNPPEGTVIKAGDTIEVTVSKGRHMVQLPPVSNTSQDEAAKVLLEAGFELTVKEEYSNTRAGNVIRMETDGVNLENRQSGTAEVEDQQLVSYGAKITIYVSRGPQPQQTRPAAVQQTAAPAQTAASQVPVQTAPAQTAPPQTAPPETPPQTTAPPQTQPPATTSSQNNDVMNAILNQQNLIGNQ